MLCVSLFRNKIGAQNAIRGLKVKIKARLKKDIFNEKPNILYN